MKYTVKFTTKFKKDFKLAMKRGYPIKLLKEVVSLLGNGVGKDGKTGTVHNDLSSCHIMKAAEYQKLDSVHNNVQNPLAEA